MKPTPIHGCTEVRADVWTRTLCGLEVRQNVDRNGWQTRAWRPVRVTRVVGTMTCARCHYVRG